MRVSDLYEDNPIRGKVILIVGSGASLSCYSKETFNLFPVVSLNDAWSLIPGKITPTIAFSNRQGFVEDCKAPIRVVKGRLKWQHFPCPKKNHDNHVPWNDKSFHVFSYHDRKLGDAEDHFEDSDLFNPEFPDYYWNVKGGSVAIFAMQFSLLCGVAGIILVGCDCSGSIRHYAIGKDVRAIVHDYSAYSRGNMRMIREARERFGVPIISATPWSGIGDEQEKFSDMMSWGKPS